MELFNGLSGFSYGSVSFASEEAVLRQVVLCNNGGGGILKKLTCPAALALEKEIKAKKLDELQSQQVQEIQHESPVIQQQVQAKLQSNRTKMLLLGGGVLLAAGGLIYAMRK